MRSDAIPYLITLLYDIGPTLILVYSLQQVYINPLSSTPLLSISFISRLHYNALFGFEETPPPQKGVENANKQTASQTHHEIKAGKQETQKQTIQETCIAITFHAAQEIQEEAS